MTNTVPTHHRCLPMTAEEVRRNLSIGGPSRGFSIRREAGGWFLYNKDCRCMPVVQCPFCNERLWSGNQVTIE